jgi:hypothetical protein
MSSSSLSPSRVAIALLCAGALAFACGPRTHSEAASTASLTTAAPVVQQGTTHSHSDGAGTLVSQLDVKLDRQEVQFALHVTNQGRKHVEVAFPNGQTHEFVVVDSLGREVWRWSESRLFTQALQNKLLGGGETMSVGERWPHPRTRGKYTVIATLNSSNYPIQQRADFVVP